MEKPEYRTGRRPREVKVYTVCQESRYLIVRNVPALGCIDELVKLFALYGPVEEYRLMDEEECEEFTDVYWIKFSSISNSRFAKRKLDEYPFLGNLLQVTYAPNFEDVPDTIAKLEERRRTIINRLKTIHKPAERQDRQQGPRDPLLGVFEPQSEDGLQEVVPVPVGSRGVYELRPVHSLMLDSRHHMSTTGIPLWMQLCKQSGRDLTRFDSFYTPVTPLRFGISAVRTSPVEQAGSQQKRPADTVSEQSKHPQTALKKSRLDTRRRI